MKKTTRAAALALFLSAPVLAQSGQGQGTLDRARALFKKVDLDADGFLNAAEAGRSQIPSRDFVSNDKNRDRKLNSDEFVIFYRQLLVKAGRTVGTDLEAEAGRIQAARRSKEAEREREKVAGDQTGDEKGSDAKRAADARDKKAAQDAERVADARDQKAAQDAQRAADARNQKAELDKQRATDARGQKAAQDADRIAAARSQKSEQDAQRIAAARDNGTTPTARPLGVAPVRTTSGSDPKKGQSPEERAQAYVKRLVAGGRLTTGQARDFYALLLAPDAKGDEKAADLQALRSAHKRAKDRISDLVRRGALSAEEGRQLSAALDERAKAAAGSDAGGARPKDGPKKKKAGLQRVPSNGVTPKPVKGTRKNGGGAKKKEPGAQRVGEVKRGPTVRPGGAKRDGDS